MAAPGLSSPLRPGLGPGPVPGGKTDLPPNDHSAPRNRPAPGPRTRQPRRGSPRAGTRLPAPRRRLPFALPRYRDGKASRKAEPGGGRPPPAASPPGRGSRCRSRRRGARPLPQPPRPVRNPGMRARARAEGHLPGGIPAPPRVPGRPFRPPLPREGAWLRQPARLQLARGDAATTGYRPSPLPGRRGGKRQPGGAGTARRAPVRKARGAACRRPAARRPPACQENAGGSARPAMACPASYVEGNNQHHAVLIPTPSETPAAPETGRRLASGSASPRADSLARPAIPVSRGPSELSPPMHNKPCQCHASDWMSSGHAKPEAL